MKNIKLLSSILSLFLILSSCSKKEDIIEMEPPVPLFGTATALLNGKQKTFQTLGLSNAKANSDFSKEQTFGLEIDSNDPTANYTRNISFSNIPFTVGSVDSLFNFKHPLLESRSYCLYTAANGDAVYAFYDLVKDLPETHFEITDFDEDTRMVTGTFNITLAIEPGITKPEELMLEDTIWLREGSFRVYVH